MIQGKLETASRFLISSMIAVAIGCGKPAEQPKTPPPATVARPTSKAVLDRDEYPGRLESPQTVVVSAQVSGIIEQAPFVEGAPVQKGDVLFVIDERPFRADFNSKEAEVASAQAQLAQADARFKRYEKLQGTRAISAEVYDEAVATLRQTRASVGVAKAALDTSRLSLEWTRVRAPISGRVSKKIVTEGNLVNGGAGQATQLTAITSVDPMYAYAEVSERNFLKYQKLAEGRKKAELDARIPCKIQLENESEFGHEGAIDFIDNHVDSTTGTIQIRCSIPNPDGRLTAGLFTRIEIPGSERYTALLIPEVAISTDQSNRYVLVLGKDDTLEYRSVKLGALFGRQRVVSEGLGPDDKIVTAGIQQLRPGTKVAPKDEQDVAAAMTPLVPTPGAHA